MLLLKGCSELRRLLGHLYRRPHSALCVQVQLLSFSAAENRRPLQQMREEDDMRYADRVLAIVKLVIMPSTSRQEAGLVYIARQAALCVPSQGFGGVINGVVDIVIALEVAWAPGQHMHMHMWHRLPSMHSILRHRLRTKGIRATVQKGLHCYASRRRHTESCGCHISISAASWGQSQPPGA